MPSIFFFTFYVYFTISSNVQWKNQALLYDKAVIKPEVVLCGNPYMKKSAKMCAKKLLDEMYALFFNPASAWFFPVIFSL